MLIAENLTCRRGGRVVLESLELRVAAHEIVALVGPAEAGKTTAFECFLGLHQPAAGRASIDDLDTVACRDAVSSLVALVPAQPSLPMAAPILTYVRNTCIRLGRRIPEAFLGAALERGGIPRAWHQTRMGDCPPSLQRKLAVTLAGLKNVSSLLIDDPTRDIEDEDLDSMIAALRALRKRGRAILLATRDLAFAHRVATRVVVLDQGCTVESYDPNTSRHSHHAGSYLADLVG